MPKYQLKDKGFVKAFKWTGGPDQVDDPTWAVEAIKEGHIQFKASGTPAVSLTIHGQHGGETGEAQQGDYVILWENGYITALSAKKFEAKYEKVN